LRQFQIRTPVCVVDAASIESSSATIALANRMAFEIGNPDANPGSKRYCFEAGRSSGACW
jgi:succinylglutamate desuccinylase